MKSSTTAIFRPALRTSAVLGAIAVVWASQRTVQGKIYDQRKAWPEEADFLPLPPPEYADTALAWAGGNQVWADIFFAGTSAYIMGEDAQRSNQRYFEQLIETIIRLDPGFERPYSHGMWLLASIDRDESALRVARQGMQRFPLRHEYPWEAGAIYQWELNTYSASQERCYRELAAELTELSMRKPDTPRERAISVAARFTEIGKKHHAMEVLTEVLLRAENPDQRERLLQTMQELGGDASNSIIDALIDLRIERTQHLPFVTDHLYTILGPPNHGPIDFARLATERDLLGAEWVFEDESADSGAAGDAKANDAKADDAKAEDEVMRVGSAGNAKRMSMTPKPGDTAVYDCAAERDWIYGRSDNRPLGAYIPAPTE